MCLMYWRLLAEPFQLLFNDTTINGLLYDVVPITCNVLETSQPLYNAPMLYRSPYYALYMTVEKCPHEEN